MYAMKECEAQDVDEEGYEILDPSGDLICVVTTREGAEALLMHLNR